MDRRGEKRVSERDAKMMGVRGFVVGRLSAGPATFEELEEATNKQLGVSRADARFALWTLADTGIIEGITGQQLSLSTSVSTHTNPKQ